MLLYFVRRFPAENTPFTVLVGSLFFFAYIVPLLFFSADVRVSEGGLLVRQIPYPSAALIPYREIRTCFGLFLVPFHLAVIVTRRRLPLTIVLAFDPPAEGDRSPFRPGKLVRQIREQIRTA